MHSATRQLSWIDFFAVAVRPRTYGSLLYLWLGFPLGIAYFVGLTVGIATGVPLTILWIGLAILLITALAAWGAAGFERQLAIHLLGAQVPERLTHPTSPRLRSRLGATLRSPALWKGMAFLLLKFPVALATWVISLVSLVVPLAFALVPFAWLVDPDGFDFHLGFWQPTSFLGTLPFGIAGVAGFLVALHLSNGMGWLWARLAEGMLGSPAVVVATGAISATGASGATSASAAALPPQAETPGPEAARDNASPA